MFTIFGTYTNGEEWDESADTFEELCEVLARLDTAPVAPEFEIEDYMLYEDGQPTMRQRILYRHLQEANAIIAKSGNPEETRMKLVDMYGCDPWRFVYKKFGRVQEKMHEKSGISCGIRADPERGR